MGTTRFGAATESAVQREFLADRRRRATRRLRGVADKFSLLLRVRWSLLLNQTSVSGLSQRVRLKNLIALLLERVVSTKDMGTLSSRMRRSIS